MLVVVGLHRANEANVIHAFAEIRKEIADQRAAFAAGTKLPAGLQENALLIREAAADTSGLAVRFEELRLVVERVHVGDAAVGENENDALRFGGVMRKFWRERVRRIAAVGEELRNDAGHQKRAAHEAAQDFAAADENRFVHFVNQYRRIRSGGKGPSTWRSRLRAPVCRAACRRNAVDRRRTRGSDGRAPTRRVVEGDPAL